MCINNSSFPSPRKPLMPVWLSVPLYLIAAVLLIGFTEIISFFIPDFLFLTLAGPVITRLLPAVAVTLLAMFFLVFIDRTTVAALGLSVKRRFKDIVAGFVCAFILYTIGFSVMVVSGSVGIADVNLNAGVLLASLIAFFFAAVTEEVMLRGYIQGRLMTRMNKFVALIIASFIFALLHIFNPNLGLFPLINLFLAGMMLGAAFLYTRNLWFPISLHLAWNWIQGPVLGFEVSGTNIFSSLLTLEMPEENIINGGAFGFEGSVICTVLLIISTVLIIGWGERKIKKNNYNHI